MSNAREEGNHRPDGEKLFFTASHEDSGASDPVLPSQPGTNIGRYKILSVLGEGGYGIVYLAEQQQPVQRKVALKIVKPGMDSRQVVARFEAERQVLALLDKVILDFYHLSEHIWSAANKCFRQDSDDAKEYASRLLHIAKYDGVATMLMVIELERKKHRRGVKRKALDELMGYIGPRAGMCDYPAYLSKHWDIGSGPTEAMCKVLAYRLKGPGMRWDKCGADAMMALVALRQSNTWTTYWDSQKHAA